MKKINQNRWFTKSLAVVGTIFIFIPIAAPLFFGFLHFLRSNKFMVDYLMPAELFPVIVVGIALLLWAAIRRRACIRWLTWSIILMVITLVGGMLIARWSGLAADEIEPIGFWWSVVMGAIILYIFTVICIGFAGCHLIKILFTQSPE